MLVVGLISYITILPVYLFHLVIKALILFNYGDLNNDFMNLLSVSSLGILGILGCLNVLILLINTWNCGKQRL
jgi:hypothetical protein